MDRVTDPEGTAATAPPARQGWLPIRSIGEQHRDRLADHLLALDERSRYLRFGYPASDEQIVRYVAGLDFERDDVFGIYNRRLELAGFAHLAYGAARDGEPAAEFGVSVLPRYRGRGFGQTLFDHAMLRARNRGVRMLLVYALSENTAMLKIARNAGAVIERAGSESECYLRLPEATFKSRLDQLLADQVGEVDYWIKSEAAALRSVLATMQEVRESVREGRHKSGS